MIKELEMKTLANHSASRLGVVYKSYIDCCHLLFKNNLPGDCQYKLMEHGHVIMLVRSQIDMTEINDN